MDVSIEPIAYRNLVSKRFRIADAVDDRKKAQSEQSEFEKARLTMIEKLEKQGLDQDLKKEIFYIIFSPPSISEEFFQHSELKVIDHHHIISDNINLDLGIYKLVNSGQWDVLEKLHRNTIEELCPKLFKDKLQNLWSQK
jgi:hypothetical protein